MWKNKIRILLMLSIMFVFAGCADHVSFSVAAHMTPVGFWYGLWHGMILPFSWIVSLFDPTTAIYAIYNNGGWYDFGFLLGCGSGPSVIVNVRRQ